MKIALRNKGLSHLDDLFERRINWNVKTVKQNQKYEVKGTTFLPGCVCYFLRRKLSVKSDRKLFLTSTWFETATFWSGVKRSTIPPGIPRIDFSELYTRLSSDTVMCQSASETTLQLDVYEWDYFSPTPQRCHTSLPFSCRFFKYLSGDDKLYLNLHYVVLKFAASKIFARQRSQNHSFH